jgi:hypothetical protein
MLSCMPDGSLQPHDAHLRYVDSRSGGSLRGIKPSSRRTPWEHAKRANQTTVPPDWQSLLPLPTRLPTIRSRGKKPGVLASLNTLNYTDLALVPFGLI